MALLPFVVSRCTFRSPCSSIKAPGELYSRHNRSRSILPYSQLLAPALLHRHLVSANACQSAGTFEFTRFSPGRRPRQGKLLDPWSAEEGTESGFLKTKHLNKLVCNWRKADEHRSSCIVHALTWLLLLFGGVCRFPPAHSFIRVRWVPDNPPDRARLTLYLRRSNERRRC